MKRGFYIVLAFVTIMVGVSCSNSKSYTDYLNDQRDAIERFIDEKGFEILSDYPPKGEFKPNEFVNMNGIYLNVIDSGRGERAVLYQTRVLCRVSGEYFLNDTLDFTIFPNQYEPMEFTYGVFTNYGPYDRYFLSEGLGMPLSLLRDSAEVKLIVPFQYGSSDAQSNYEPMYFDRVRYIFKK